MEPAEEKRFILEFKEDFYYFLTNRSALGRVSWEFLQVYVGSDEFKWRNMRSGGNGFKYLGKAIDELFSGGHLRFDASTREYVFDEETTRNIAEARSLADRV